MAQRQIDLADREEERLTELRTHQPLIVQLADAIAKRHVNMRAVELLRSWHGSNEGGITFQEFITNVRAMGLSADRDEVEALFHILDEDKSGFLGLANLKAGLVKLKVASATPASYPASSSRARAVHGTGRAQLNQCLSPLVAGSLFSV